MSPKINAWEGATHAEVANDPAPPDHLAVMLPPPNDVPWREPDPDAKPGRPDGEPHPDEDETDGEQETEPADATGPAGPEAGAGSADGETPGRSGSGPDDAPDEPSGTDGDVRSSTDGSGDPEAAAGSADAGSDAGGPGEPETGLAGSAPRRTRRKSTGTSS